jgi:hypothetical protein
MTTFDGGVYRYDNGNASFILNMREENMDYIDWVKSTIENITSVVTKVQPNYNKDGYNRKPIVRLTSRQHPYFNKIRDRVYIDNHKVIDPHMITLMDDEALAIIFMADGSTGADNRWTNPHCKIDLCTKGFSYADNLALSKAIYERCGIRSTVHRHYKYYYLSIKSSDHIDFVSAILPYLCKSFYYKLERIAPALKHRLGGDIV